MLHDLLDEPGVHAQRLLLRLVAGQLADELAQLRRRLGRVPAGVVALEPPRQLAQPRRHHGEVGVAQLLVQLVRAVEQDLALQAGLRRLVLLAGRGADDRGAGFDLVVFDAVELVDEAFVGELREQHGAKVDFPVDDDQALDGHARHHTRARCAGLFICRGLGARA